MKTPKHATFAHGPLGSLTTAALKTADALGFPATHQFGRRKLWSSLARRPAAVPEGPKQVALTFDLDYQADTDVLVPLCDLLAGAEATATMFSIGRLVEDDPDPYAHARDAGHEIANHTHTHPNNPVLDPDREFWHLDVGEMRDQIARCQDAIEDRLGLRPTGFRTPHFKDAYRMMEALEAFPEITYASTVLASRSPSAVPYFPVVDPAGGDESLVHTAAGAGPNHGRLQLPLTPCPGVRWSPFCSYLSIREPANPALGAGLHDVPTFESLWKEMLRRCGPDRYCSVYFDPMDVMRDAETSAAFARMLAHARETGWELAPLADVEAAWRRVLPTPPPAR